MAEKKTQRGGIFRRMASLLGMTAALGMGQADPRNRAGASLPGSSFQDPGIQLKPSKSWGGPPRSNPKRRRWKKVKSAGFTQGRRSLK